MAKKLSYGLKAVSGNPPKWLSMAMAIVSLLAVSKDQLIGSVPGVADTTLEHLSQWYDYLMNIAQAALGLAVIFTGYKEDKPDTDDVHGGYKNTVRTLLLLIAMGLLCSSCSKKTLDINREYSKTDSSWTTQKQVPVFVPGGSTPAVNMDSLKQLLQRYMSVRNNAELPGFNTMAPNITNKVFTIPDTSGRYELQYWIDATGKLFANCVAKDGTINALVNENNRLIRERELVKEKKKVTRMPTWFIVILIIAGILTVYGLVKDVMKLWPLRK